MPNIIKPVIPQFIQEQYLADIATGSLQAFTLCVDFSGFTALSESLMQQGAKGAEVLSNVLNKLLGDLTTTVYRMGGFIPYFAGDALTGIFVVSDEKACIPLARYAVSMFQLFIRDVLSEVPHSIGVKMGMSIGEVQWGIVGDSEKAYYFTGQAIHSCAICQSKAQDGQVVIDKQLRWVLPENDFSFTVLPAEPGYYMVQLTQELSVESLVQIRDKQVPQQRPTITRQVGQSFYANRVLDSDQLGEFRPVISVFIAFDIRIKHEELDVFASIITSKVNSYGAYFKEIDYGDKGAVMAIFFGAPIAFENVVERALEFILSVQEELQILPGTFSMKTGMTIGTAFTGWLGNVYRMQYAIVGNRVNLAARFMSFASWGDVLCDEEIAKKVHYRFAYQRDESFKGFKEPVSVYKLLGRNEESIPVFPGRLVGRTQELNSLINDLQQALNENPARLHLSYIYGEPGLGKSRLAFELKKWVLTHTQARWFLFPSDQILRKPFNSFIYFLRNYFDQSIERSIEENRLVLQNQTEDLLENLSRIDHPMAPELMRELTRAVSIISALLGLPSQHTIWEQLDAKGRYQGVIQSITQLLYAESLLSPLVFQFEDIHWLDASSRELIQELARRMAGSQVYFLCTSRLDENGEKPNLGLSVVDFPNTQVLDLSTLSDGSLREMAEIILNAPVSEEVFGLLDRISNHNPFYVEQILEYFKERAFIVLSDDGIWTLKDSNIKLSSSIYSILTARIDQLSTPVQEAVKAAAVIGREFEIPVLSEVLRNQKPYNLNPKQSHTLLKEQVHQAEQGQIWLPLNEIRYMFRHALLREAAYSMQLKARLKEMHLSIAEAMERIYAEQLEERYPDLAFHYEEAENYEKALQYLIKAADQALDTYQNQQALELYTKAYFKIDTTKPENAKIAIDLLIQIGYAEEHQGDWQEAKKSFDKALALAKQTRDTYQLARSHNGLGKIYLLLGNYPESRSSLQTAVTLFESIDDFKGLGKALGDMGDVYFRQGQYDDAKSFFERSIELSKKGGKKLPDAQIVANLGLTFMNRGEYTQGIQSMAYYLEQYREDEDLQAEAVMLINMGIVRVEQGNYDEAMILLQQGLEVSEDIGAKHLVSIAMGMIGSVLERRGDYDQAMMHYEKDLKLCEEMGDKQGTAIVLGLIGELHSYMGNFHKAIEYLQKDLMLCEELGYQKGTAKAVNTLGDIFFYSGDYNRSMYYYDQAIQMARRINNRLVLGFSLVEKATVFLALNQYQDAKVYLAEVQTIASELGNPDLRFEAWLLEGKCLRHTGDPGSKDIFESMLHWPDIDESQLAMIHYEYYLSGQNQVHREQAIALYERLFSLTPRFIYKKHLEVLKNGG